MTLPAIPHVLHITDIQYYHTVYYAYIFNIGFSTRLYIYFFHIVNKYFKKATNVNNTFTLWLYCHNQTELQFRKRKKPICHNGVNESTDHCNVLFWGGFFCQMRCLSAITILVLPSTCSCISWLLCIIYQSNYQHSLSVHRG